MKRKELRQLIKEEISKILEQDEIHVEQGMSGVILMVGESRIQFLPDHLPLIIKKLTDLNNKLRPNLSESQTKKYTSLDEFNKDLDKLDGMLKSYINQYHKK